MSGMPRSVERNEIVVAIKAAINGLAILPRELLPRLLNGGSDPDDLFDGNEAVRALLTPRELEVLAAMADGASNKAIARRSGNVLPHRQVSRRRHSGKARCGQPD